MTIPQWHQDLRPLLEEADYHAQTIPQVHGEPSY